MDGLEQGRIDGEYIRQRRCLMSLGTALVVPLQERHDECGACWLDNMEQVQQNDHHQRDTQQPHNESW
jgi:hypothetical protein